MTRQEIEAQIIKIIATSFELDENSIELDSNLYDDLDLDSIDAVDLVVQLQKISGSKIDPESFKTVKTVRNVVDAVEAILAE